MVETEIRRTQERLRDEMRLVEKALRIRRMTSDEAGAYASKGARYECDHKPISPSRFMEVPRGQPQCTEKLCRCPSPEGQRFVTDVIRFVDHQHRGIPLYLVARVPYLFGLLPSLQQWVLELTVRRGMSYREAAAWVAPWGRTLGIGKSQIANLRAKALESIALQCWDGDGQPIYG